ncbi:MAG: hypothetical protein ABIO99_08430 [Candidatus Limnocylindria bacterium]
MASIPDPAGRPEKTFPLRHARPWRWLLRIIGVKPGAAQVTLTADERLVARFGVFGIDTPLANVNGYQLAGPYRFWRAIGPRGSGADHGFTFGTSTHGGVCLCFGEPVDAWFARGDGADSLTVTVDDIAGLARSLESRGVRGTDRRER